MDNISKLLMPNKELRENLDQFKEAFIEFYGEEARAEIEEKFSKILPIGYISPEQLSRNLRDIEQKFTDDQINQILQNNQTTLSKKDLIDNYSFDYFNLQPIYKYQRFYEAFCLGAEERQKRFIDMGYEIVKSDLSNLTREEYNRIIEEKRLPERYENISQSTKVLIKYYTNEKSSRAEYRKLYEDAEPLLKKIIPEIEISNFKDYLEDTRLIELNKILDSYQNSIESYNNFKESIKEYYEKEKLISDSKQKLEEEYHKKLISKYKHLIPEDKRVNLEEYLRGEKKGYELDRYVEYLFGYSLFSEHPLDFFTTESENMISEGRGSNWRRNEITKGRIYYFKNNGINLGDNYEAYLGEEALKEIWPSPELADSFVAFKNECLNGYNNELYTTSPDHQNIRQEIDSLNLLNKDDCFDASIYMRAETFVAPNVRLNNNIHELFSLFVISFDNQDDNFRDHFVVHELNHVYELCLKLVGEKEYTTTCGWDILVEDIKDTQGLVNTTGPERKKRPYELFNEIINELIAQEISKIMHKNNTHVFDNPKTAKYQHSTSYEHSLFLVKNFFDEFRDKIIESRRNGNIQVIWNEVGKDNFDELNSLFKIYNDNFSGFRIYNLLSDLSSGKDTEQTRVYYDLVDRKNRIMENMRNFQMTKQTDYERQVTI